MSITANKYGQNIAYTVKLSGGTVKDNSDSVFYNVKFSGDTSGVMSHSAGTGSSSILNIEISKNNTWIDRSITSNTQHIDAVKLNRGVGLEVYVNENIVQPFIEYTINPNGYEDYHIPGSEQTIILNFNTSGSQFENYWLAYSDSSWITFNDISGDTGTDLTINIAKNNSGIIRSGYTFVRNAEDLHYSDGPNNNSNIYVFNIIQDKYYMDIKSEPSGYTAADYNPCEVDFTISASGSFNTVQLSDYHPNDMFSSVTLTNTVFGIYNLNCVLTENNEIAQRSGSIILENDIDSGFTVEIPIVQPGRGISQIIFSGITKDYVNESCDIIFNINNINRIYYMALQSETFDGTINDFIVDPRTITISTELSGETETISVNVLDTAKDVYFYYIGVKDDKYFTSENVEMYNFDLFKVYANIDAGFIEVNDGDTLDISIVSEIYEYNQANMQCEIKSIVADFITQKQLSFRIGPNEYTNNTSYSSCFATISNPTSSAREILKESATIGGDWYEFPKTGEVSVVDEMCRLLFVPSYGDSLDLYFHADSATCSVTLIPGGVEDKKITFNLNIITEETCSGEPL